MTLNVAVLFGGVSTEYEVSLRSARNILDGLRRAGHHAMPIGITPQGDWKAFAGPKEALTEARWQEHARVVTAANCASPRDFLLSFCDQVPDCVFPAVHGVNCEDGSLQGFLTLTGLPYVGSGVLASAVAMDKLQTKRLLQIDGLPLCPHHAVRRSDFQQDPQGVIDRVLQGFDPPLFVKPSNGGSSVGTGQAKDREQLLKAIEHAASYDRDILVEPFIDAREVEVAVLGNDDPETGVLGEIVTGDGVDYYDYRAKYLAKDGARVVLPADVRPDQAETLRRLALKAYRSLGCAGLARIDFFIERSTQAIYLNEINTLPGFTAISVYPQAFAQAGLALPQLVDRLCHLAIEAGQSRQRQECMT